MIDLGSEFDTSWYALGMPFNTSIAALVAFGIVLLFVIVKLARSRSQASAVEIDHERLYALQNEWQAPAELTAAPTPRAVQLAGQAKLALFFGVLFLAALGFVGVYMYRSITQSQERLAQLQRDGETTQGQVVSKSSTSGRSKRYYVTYRFTMGDSVYQRRAAVSSSVYRQVQEGQQVRVIYLPLHPAYSRLEIENEPPPTWIVIIPCAVFLLAAAAFVLPILSQRKLLQYGQPAPAIVTRNSFVKGGRLIRYRFLDSANNEIDGQTTMRRKEGPEPGSMVTIIYDPGNSKRNSIYPMQFVRLSGIG